MRCLAFVLAVALMGCSQGSAGDGDSNRSNRRTGQADAINRDGDRPKKPKNQNKSADLEAEVSSASGTLKTPSSIDDSEGWNQPTDQDSAKGSEVRLPESKLGWDGTVIEGTSTLSLAPIE